MCCVSGRSGSHTPLTPPCAVALPPYLHAAPAHSPLPTMQQLLPCPNAWLLSPFAWPCLGPEPAWAEPGRHLPDPLNLQARCTGAGNRTGRGPPRLQQLWANMQASRQQQDGAWVVQSVGKATGTCT